MVAMGEFRALWSAQVLSSTGDQFARVAIAILVYDRTHSAVLTALAYALTYLPPIAGGPLLASLADLFPRRRVTIVCDVFRVGTVGLMAVPGRSARFPVSSQARPSSPFSARTGRWASTPRRSACRLLLSLSG